MKTISSYENKICRLECACCAEDHYADFSMPTKRYLLEDGVVYIKFKTSLYSFKDRIRIAHDLSKDWKNLKECKTSFNGVIVEYSQLSELYSTLLLEYQQNDILKPEDIITLNKIKFMRSSDQYKNDPTRRYSLFTSKGGLMIQCDIGRSSKDKKHYVDFENKENKLIIQNIDIGYAIPELLSKWEIFKRQIKFIFSNTIHHRIFYEYELSLSKEELVQFMNILLWIMNNYSEKEDGGGDYEIKDESVVEWC